ncbi:MAG: DUF4258 domain-containing protein [Nitrospirae bacterium YQR-1]
MKPIRLSKHAREQLFYRGVDEKEVIETIMTSQWEFANNNRYQAVKTYTYGKNWNNKFYAFKQVKPIFIEEETEMVVITVYAYFFNKEG